MEKTLQNLISELQRYAQKNGFQKAVVGISGGVDSAVTTAIAVRAFGKENVVGILMPHKDFSSAENLQDARKLGEILDIGTQEIEISPFAKEFFTLPWNTSPLNRGNTLARIRMVILYSWANAHNALVLGTCNKSETLLGYETKFGDGASDVSVLGDLWKTEVWTLARELNLPEKFITKAPSAELFADHTDEEELGFSYPTADAILQQWERGEKLDEKDPVSQKILLMIRRSEHKRNISPTLKK